MPRAGFADRSRVADENGEVLRHLSELGLCLDTQIEVLRAEPIEGVLKLRLASAEITLAVAPAARVWVESKVVSIAKS